MNCVVNLRTLPFSHFDGGTQRVKAMYYHLRRWEVSRLCDEKLTPFSYHRRGVTALGKAAVTAALGAENYFKPRHPSEASRLG